MDIANAKAGDNRINNGSSVCSALPTGRFTVKSDRADQKPPISEIENKYVDKFDEITYYQN